MATQLNFAQQMDAVLKTLDGTRPRLLLHACCGPCSSAVLEQLCQYFDITVLYYNPNTWPAEEYYRRGEELKKFVAAAHPLGVTVVEDTYDPQEFYTAVQSAAFGGIWPVPAGLLRVRVQRKGQRNRKVLMEQMPLKKKVAKPALRRRVLCCSMMFLDFSRKGLFLH